METVYVVEPGAYLQKSGNSLNIMKEKQLLQAIPAKDLEKLILSGYVSMSGSVMNFLISNRVETVFVTPTGRFRARLMIDEHKHVALRKAQYLKLTEDAFGRKIMKVLVRGKLQNMAAVLFRRAADYKDDTLRDAAIGLKALIKNMNTELSRDAVRGIEGAGSRIYFSVFSRMIRNDAFFFRGRNRRPPLDPVNALLSFAYTLLTNEVLSAIKTVGLDPYLGSLHEVSYGRPSLACDLVEEYRSIVADRLVLTLLNRKMVKPDDFTYRENVPGTFVDEVEMKQKRPVEMKPYLLKAFLAAYESMMRGSRNYRQTMRNQVRQFADCLVSPEKEYRPLREL